MMLNPRGYSGVLMDTVKSERAVILVPILFINFFTVGFVLNGVLFGFGELTLSMVLMCVTFSMSIFFGELVLLLIPVKVLVDRKLAPDLKTDRDIIRLSFDEQDREIFRRLKVASNSIILILTGLINYFIMALFVFMWYSNDAKPLPPYTVMNGLIPVYAFFIVLNFIAMAYNIVKGRRQ
ncbi:MAG: hypothetical protein V1875_10425 [Candidatus Altiarchaeota archaeon]